MREIKDTAILQSYMDEYNINEYFATKGLEFRLYEYEEGEIINNIQDTSEWIQFVVDGTLQIYGLHMDGRLYPICSINDFTVLGDVEFSGIGRSILMIEAKTDVRCIAVSLLKYRKLLLEDTVFLRCMLKSLAYKLSLYSEAEEMLQTVEDKLINYMENQCPDRMISDIGDTAFRLHCSRRQLQRTLKKLSDEDRVCRVKKGCYKMIIN